MKDKLKDREGELLLLWDNGLSVKELAVQYSVTPGSLRAFLNKHQRSTARKMAVTMPILDVKDAAYIAGIIDGEGCISVRAVTSRGCSYLSSRLVVATGSKNLMEYLARVTGSGFKAVYGRTEKPKWKSMYRWELGSLQASELLKQLLPYLQVKREQAELFIELTEIKLKSKPGHRFAEERQNEIVRRLRELNQRGVVIEETL